VFTSFTMPPYHHYSFLLSFDRDRVKRIAW
jgi:hypothetical protein